MNWKLLGLASFVVSLLGLLHSLKVYYRMEGFQVMGDDSKAVLEPSQCGALMDQLRSTREDIEKYRKSGEASALNIAYKVYDTINAKRKELGCKDSDTAPKADVDMKALELTPEQKVELQKQAQKLIAEAPKDTSA